jgi:hypothetical protein
MRIIVHIQIATIIAASSVLASCARFQPTTPAMSASDYTPKALLQSVTMKNSGVHYDAEVLKPGESRSQIQATFGEPNATRTTDSGQNEDIYAFNPDGTKFVNPQVRPRNLALAFFTRGMSLAVRQARLKLAESKLKLYHVSYSSDGIVESVREEDMSGASETGTGAQETNSASEQSTPEQ